MKAAIFSILSIVVILGGCTTPENIEFPSLAKRPIENLSAAEQTNLPAPPPQIILPAGLSGQIAALEERGRKADAAFQRLLPETRNIASAAKGAARSSDLWIGAHIALSTLDQSRADAVAALAEMDQLLLAQAEAALTGKARNYAPLMQPAQKRLSAIVDAQGGEIQRLGNIIGY